MKRIIMSAVAAILMLATTSAQVQKVYDENIDPMVQIDAALARAKSAHHYVVCQVGGNWCPWCLRFADFVVNDSSVNALVTDNFEFIHVNYPRRNAMPELKQRLNNPERFGFPVFVVLDADGNVIHIQDSSFLEEGKGYNKEKVIRFFKNWTPSAVEGK